MQQQKFNGCINILSSRTRCLPVSIKSFQDKWNYRYNYPIYVHYFDDIYDNPILQSEILKFTKADVRFISIPYWTPSEIPEEELFYNRKDLWYVKTGRFGPHRKGFLHMNRFFNNLYGYPNTEFEKYDYIFSFDDESLFLKEVPYDFFEVMASRPEACGAIKITHPHIKAAHQGTFDCRVGMMDFVINYMRQHNIEPTVEFLQNLLTERDDKEKYFHDNLVMADSWVFKTAVFKTPEWKTWSSAVNDSGGIFKYRWGDCELNVLFFLIYYGELPYDFKTVDEGYHDQGGLRYVQDYAPSVKDFNR